MARREVGIGLCALVVGAVVGFAIGRTGGQTAASPARSEGPAAAVPCAPCPACPAPAAAPEEPALEAVVDAQDAQIRGLSAAAFGEPLAWPDPAVVPALEQEILDALAACAPHVGHLGTDCSEPPCLVSLDLGDDGSGQITRACPTLKRLGFRGYRARQKRCADGSVRNFMVVPVGRADDYRAANEQAGLDFAENESTRIRLRTDDAESTFSCDPS